jgi:hypothetical protein
MENAFIAESDKETNALDQDAHVPPEVSLTGGRAQCVPTEHALFCKVKEATDQTLG